MWRNCRLGVCSCLGVLPVGELISRQLLEQIALADVWEGCIIVLKWLNIDIAVSLIVIGCSSSA